MSDETNTGTAINWQGPLEAVHEDGRVVAVTSPRETALGNRFIQPTLDSGYNTFRHDGIHFTGSSPWTIRNAKLPSSAHHEAVQRDLGVEIAESTSGAGDALWGPEIAVSGRPKWIRDGEDVMVDVPDVYGWCVPCKVMPGQSWYSIAHIKLRQDHPYYTVAAHNAAHPTSPAFEYWGGGEEAPGDVGHGILLRNGMTSAQGNRWNHTAKDDGLHGFDIIGYRTATARHMGKEAIAKLGTFDPAPHLATYDPAREVVVARMTEEEFDVWAYGNTYYESRDHIKHALNELGIIRTPSVPADLLTAREICAEVAVEKYDDDLGPRLAGHYRDGGYDTGNEMTIALKSLRWGK